jgi:YD repeat-containing protein
VPTTDRVAEVEDPLGAVTVFAYDGNGNLVSRTDANLHATGFVYDELDRMTAKVYPGGVDVESFTYDGNGNRVEQVEVNGGGAETTTYAYDGADRLLEVAYPEETVAYTYDPVGG